MKKKPAKKAAKRVKQARTRSAVKISEKTATTAEKPKRGRPFKPGESGNPKGRPKGSLNKTTAQFRAWCREAVSQVDFLDYLLLGLQNGTLDTSLIKLVIEQAHGRAPGAIDISVDFDHLEHLRVLSRRKQAEGKGVQHGE